jgi:polyisoprenoid-binding protein YceI
LFNFNKKLKMKKLLSTVYAVLLVSSAASAQTFWAIDKSHSAIKFSVQHMMVAETDGKFKLYDGNVNAKGEDFTDAVISFSVDVASVNTDDEKRDGHLKSDDFFNAEKYPKMIFKSTSMKKGTGKNEFILTGDLTIRDVTKKVSFVANFGGVTKDPWGNTRAGFKITGSVNRIEYGLKWNAALEAGGIAVSETVNIMCNVELIKQK